jgi:hypothetical protein
MEEVTITIRTINAAFVGDEDGEVQRILKELSENPIKSKSILDINGNKVGYIKVK